MKKKILATVLAGAMVATCAASLAACGDSKVSMPKGDEVTAEEWAEFFEKTTEVKNYTLEYSVDSTATIKGTYKAPTGMDITKKKEQTIEGKSKLSESGLALYDEEGNKAYAENKSSSELSMKGDEDKSTSESEGIEKEYYELKAEKDGVKTEGEGNLKIEETDLVPVSYNLDYTYKAESVYSLTNIKSTDVSKKVDKDITKALDKAKAEAEEANA